MLIIKYNHELEPDLICCKKVLRSAGLRKMNSLTLFIITTISF